MTSKILERRMEIEHKVMGAALTELKDMVPNTEFVIFGYEQIKGNSFLFKAVMSMDRELAVKFLRIILEKAEAGMFAKNKPGMTGPEEINND